MELLFRQSTKFQEDNFEHGANIEPERPGSPILSSDYDSDSDDRFSVVRDSLKLAKRKQKNESFEDFYFSHVEHALNKISRPKASTSEFINDNNLPSMVEAGPLKFEPTKGTLVGSLKKSKLI